LAASSSAAAAIGEMRRERQLYSIISVEPEAPKKVWAGDAG
jgi:hypothetical protein